MFGEFVSKGSVGVTYILIAFGAFGALYQVDYISGGTACVFLGGVCFVVMGGSDLVFLRDGYTTFAAWGFAWH